MTLSICFNDRRVILLSLCATFFSGCAAVPQANVWKPTAVVASSTDICYQRVRELEKLPLDATDPTDGFLRNQHCIALKACQHKPEFENPVWLDQVMADFIDPYTQQQRDWGKVMAHCQQRSTANPLRNLLCQREMARYHIFTDLRGALAHDGCSTAADWQRLEGYISGCIDEADYPPLLSDYIKNRVVTYRNRVRQQCLSKPSPKEIKWGGLD